VEKRRRQAAQTFVSGGAVFRLNNASASASIWAFRPVAAVIFNSFWRDNSILGSSVQETGLEQTRFNPLE
jgi:hypothetical protein